MAISRERFEEGLSYEEFKAQMTRNQERFAEVESTVSLSAEEVAYFKNLPSPLNVAILAEDWCGDVIANLPVIQQLAEKSGKLNISIFLRDQNLDIMDQYLKEGQFRSIPVFVFFDENFRELGYWIERPAKMSELTQEYRRTLFATLPELSGFEPTISPSELPEDARQQLSQALSTFRAEKRHFSDSEVIREIRDLLLGGSQSKPSVIPIAATAPSWKKSTSAPAEQPIKVSITYCAECGYEPQTLGLTSALMIEFRDDLASIEIIPWQDGMFDVVVDGELIHSMKRDGGFPENETILGAVRSRLGVAQPS